jgi:hypothetical protein
VKVLQQGAQGWGVDGWAPALVHYRGTCIAQPRSYTSMPCALCLY